MDAGPVTVPARPPFTFLPIGLREPQSAARSIATGWLLAFFPSIFLSWLVSSVAPDMQTPDFKVSGDVAFFLLVGFAPVVETLIMGVVLELLRKFLSPPVAVLFSAAGWGLAHSATVPAWGLVIWWPFLIFSTLYTVWRPRGFWPAVGVAAATHAAHNLAPALMVAFNLT